MEQRLRESEKEVLLNTATTNNTMGLHGPGQGAESFDNSATALAYQDWEPLCDLSAKVRAGHLWPTNSRVGSL